MKNNILHKLPLIFLLLWEHILPAQVVVYDSVPSWGSIIRAIDSRQNILYFEDASGQGSFLLHSPTTCASIKLPSGMSVADFEVDASGNAWFCGDDYSFNYLNTYNRIQLFSPGCARPIMAKPPEQTNSTGVITSAERSYTHTARDFTFYPTVTPVNTIPECDE